MLTRTILAAGLPHDHDIQRRVAIAPDRLHGRDTRTTAPQSPHCRSRNQTRNAELTSPRTSCRGTPWRPASKSSLCPCTTPRSPRFSAQTVYRRLVEVPGDIDIVNVFRRPEHVPPHVDDILAKRPRAVLDAARNQKRGRGGTVGPRRHRGGSGSMSEGRADANGPLTIGSRRQSASAARHFDFPIPYSRFPTRSGRAWPRAARPASGPRLPASRRWR